MHESGDLAITLADEGLITKAKNDFHFLSQCKSGGSSSRFVVRQTKHVGANEGTSCYLAGAVRQPVRTCHKPSILCSAFRLLAAYRS
jgi:hypothetical protein